VSCYSAQPVQKLATTPEMLSVTRHSQKMMFWALARVSFCAAKSLAVTIKQNLMVYLQHYFSAPTKNSYNHFI
jgi:hypothetical protein